MSDVVPVGLGLGLIGFVFSSGAEGGIGVSLCGIRGWVGFKGLGIGFVLRGRGFVGW